MSIKRQLQRSINNLLRHNRDGSYETQSSRKHILFQAAEELCASGYKLRHIQGLKQKHIGFLNNHWKQQQLKPATIKNRNAHLRWLSEKINKVNIVPSNAQLSISKRQYANNVSDPTSTCWSV